jgi:hypothetical protein
LRLDFKHGFKDRTRGEWLALFFFAAIIVYQCFVPPVVGLSDNGDFEKVLGIFSVGAPPPDDPWKFVRLKYEVDSKYHSWREFISTEQVFAGIAILLNTLFSKQGTFDIRLLGLVHAALLMFAFYLLQPLLRGWRPRSRVLLYLALMAVFGDVMYVSWLNTAYMDTSALLCLLLSAVLCVRAIVWKRASDQFGFVAAAVLFTASKSAHSVLGLALAGLLLVSPRVFPRILRGIGSALILIAMMVTLRFVPYDYQATGLYSALFYELLPHSKNLTSDLRELGLDDSYRPAVGTYAYQEGNPFQDPQFVRQFAARASYLRLSLFLIRHPALAYRGIRDGLDFAGAQRPPLGNFAREAGLASGAQSQAFALWSGLKAKILAYRGSVYVFYFLGTCIALCGILWWRHHEYFAGGVSLCLMAFLAVGIASFADAVEVTRHFFLFNALVDLMLLSVLAALLAPRQKSTQKV